MLHRFLIEDITNVFYLPVDIEPGLLGETAVDTSDGIEMMAPSRSQTALVNSSTTPAQSTEQLAVFFEAVSRLLHTQPP